MPENHFGEEVATRYDEPAADMFDPVVLDPAIDSSPAAPETARRSS